MDEKLPSPAPRRSSYRPMLLALLFSFLLAGGSCSGFLATLRGNSPANTIFAACFLLCVAVFAGSIVWMVAKALRENSRGRT